MQLLLIALSVVGSGIGMDPDKSSIIQLFDAIKCSRCDEMKNIITQNPDIVNAYHYSSDLREEVTPLHVAAHQGDISTLELLLKNQAYEQCGAETKKWKRIPLHYAENKTIAKALCKHRYNIACKDVFGNTPFEHALDYWLLRYDLAHYLLKYGGNINASNCSYNNTMLHNAVCCNNIDKVTFLLQHNAKPVGYNNNGQTPLDLAIEGKYYQIIELFKKAGIFFISGAQCNLFALLHNNAQELRSLKPGSQYEIGTVNLLAQLLMSVRSSRQFDKRQAIVINADGITFKHSSRDNLCKLFGEKSINYVEELIDECYVTVETIGYLSSWKGDIFKRKVMEYPFVLAYDKDQSFKILLHIMLKDTDLFASLFTREIAYENGGLVFKPDLSGVDEDGNTLLHCAIMHDQVDPMAILIENNIDLMCRNKADKTALDLVHEWGDKDNILCFNDAVAHKFLDTPSYDPEYKNIKTFLKSGFDINAPISRAGQTLLTLVLHYAVPSKRYDQMAFLLKHDALVTEDMIQYEAFDYYWALLQKKYDEQECCVCYEHFSGMSDIPCGSVHENNRLCKGCYTTICEKNNRQCPLCRGELGEYSKNKAKKCTY